MARTTSRSNDWGFPRWRGYGSERGATRVRLCDREGCDKPGDRPAPKSPNSPERWMFCEDHAAEYNRGWNYFEGLSAEEAAAREADERRSASGFAEASHYAWGGPGDGTRSRDEMRALEVLELDSDAGFDDVKAAWRRLAKANHPDLKPGDAAAAARFQAVQAAYEVLARAEERRGPAMKRHVRSNWAETLLVCRKCEKKLGGGFGADGDEKLAKALRKHAGGKGRKARFGVVEVGCLKVCPKRAVTVVRGSVPGDWQIVEAGTPLPAVMARLGLAAAPANDAAEGGIAAE